MISFFLSVRFPPNSEGSAELCEAIGTSLRTQVRIILLCLLTLTPFDGSADTLAKAKRLTHFYSVAPLPGKWFACFPTSGDSLRFVFFRLSPTRRGRLFCMSHFFIFIFTIKGMPCLSIIL